MIVIARKRVNTQSTDTRQDPIIIYPKVIGCRKINSSQVFPTQLQDIYTASPVRHFEAHTEQGKEP